MIVTSTDLNPYDYEEPRKSKIITMICPDIYAPMTKDALRSIIGNVFVDDTEEIDAYDVSVDFGLLDPATATAWSGGELAGGIKPQFLNLEEDFDENGYEVVNINISENPYISHARMATTLINSIDTSVIVPNFKIPMRLYGSDPNMPGGDQFWYAYFMGGEYAGETYDQKLDANTVFYDECLRIPMPYTDIEYASMSADSYIGLGKHSWSEFTLTPEFDPYGMLLKANESMALCSIKPKMQYYNQHIGKYISWGSGLSSERLLPNHSVYESLAETNTGEMAESYGYKTVLFDSDIMEMQLGPEMLSYVAQWDLPNTVTSIKSSTPQPPGPYFNPEEPINPYAGMSAKAAKWEILNDYVLRDFGDADKSTDHYWAESTAGFYLRNTASCAKYLYYYSINSFSGSTISAVDKRNENIFFTEDHWLLTYANAGPDPDRPVYGLFPYHVKIVFPTHTVDDDAYNVGYHLNQDPQNWWTGRPTDITDEEPDLIETWDHPYSFLQGMSKHDFTSKFMETLKDMSDGNWAPLPFGETQLVKHTFKLKTYGDATTQSRPGRASVTTHQAIKYDRETTTENFRSFDYIEFLRSVYNNPSEELNTNFMFMGGDISAAKASYMEFEATYRNDGLHRYFNSSGSIGTLTDATRTLLKTYDRMMNRMIETDDTIGDGDITDDYFTIKGFLEPNLRHSEIIAYRVEKLGGYTVGDQANTNVLQNFWSINNWVPRDAESDSSIDETNPLGFFQMFDTQLKYAHDYTYNIYAYALTLGYRYRYGDFRLTRQLSYDEEDEKYCLEFYDPFTMERKQQLFSIGSGLQARRGVAVLTGLWSYFQGADKTRDLFAGDEQGQLKHIMSEMVFYYGSLGDDGVYGSDSSLGTSTTSYSESSKFPLGYVDGASRAGTYSNEMWLVAMDELNRRAGEWMIQTPESLAALDSSVFESEIWQQYGIAGNHTNSGAYESIFDQMAKAASFLRESARIGANPGLYTGPLMDAYRPEEQTMDFDALYATDAPPGQVGTIQHDLLARMSAISSGEQTYTRHPFLMDYNIYIEPCLKVIEIPMMTRNLTLTDNPACPSNTIPYQHIDASKKIGFHCLYESQQTDVPYPPALSTEEAVAKVKYLASNILQPHESIGVEDQTRSPQRFVEVFRIDEKPKTFLDFEGKLIKTIDLKIEDTQYHSEDALFSDKIEENKKYYYIIRFKNELGVPGWPSPVYEVELVNDGGYNYAVFNEYEIEPQESTDESQERETFKKLFQIQPNLSHLNVVSDSVDYSKTAGNQLENLDVGSAESLIWGKKFKIRLVSKKTGKKIDLNVKFNLKEEDKFALV